MKPNEIKSKDWYHYNGLFLAEHFLGSKTFQKYFGASQKKLYYKISNYLSKQNQIDKKQVESLEKDISREDFLKLCYEPGLPKVFRGAAANWEAIKKWNPDFFEEHYGTQKIYLNDNVGIADQEFEELSLGDYIKQFKARTLKYLRFSDVVNHNPELKNDFDMDWIRNYNLPHSWGEDTKMFMGAKGTLTPLHVGLSDFLFVQVMGRKKWILYPTNNRLHLDVRTERTFHYYSNANPYKLDDPNFPLLKFAQCYEVYLEPGDVLWVPSFVWHHVENLDDTIGIRCGRSSLASAAKSSKILTALIFLATKPNIFSHAIATRTQKRSLVFMKSRTQLNDNLFNRLNPFKRKTKI